MAAAEPPSLYRVPKSPHEELGSHNRGMTLRVSRAITRIADFGVARLDVPDRLPPEAMADAPEVKI